MNKTLSICLKIISVTSLVVCTIWAWQQRDFEPIAAALGSLAALIALFIVEPNSTSRPTVMKQKGGKNSTNYQAGGSITINPKSK